MSGICREAFPDVREWSGGPQGYLGVVGRPSRRSGSGREALKIIWEWSGTLPDVRDWSGFPPGCPGVVGKPYRRSGSGREALPDVREWSGGPTGCPGLVGSPSWM